MSTHKRWLEPSYVMRRCLGANLWLMRPRDRIARFFWNHGL